MDTRYRAPFIKLIAVIRQEPSHLRLVLTLHADYYEHCTRNEQLAALLREASFPLSAPNTHALTEMIERPARIAGLKLGDGLAGAILDDVGAEPGALSLVEFSLAELYECSGGERMTAEAYRALGRQDGANGNTGGIGGVIDRQAEQAVQDDQGRVDERTLSKIFPLLADVDEKGGAVRKRAKLDDFVGPERALVDRLVNGRLLLTNREEGTAAWVEVAHEAVLRHWQRFQTWLKENQKFLLWRQSLKHWMKRKTPLPSAELNEGEAWREKLGRDAFTIEEKAYLTKSRWNLRWQRAKLV